VRAWNPLRSGGCVFGFYVASIALVLTVIRWDAIRPGFSPFTLALQELHYRRASYWMGAVILVAALLMLNSALAICSRVLNTLRQRSQALTGVAMGNVSRPRGSGRVGAAMYSLVVLCVAACWRTRAYAYLVSVASVLLMIVYILFVLAASRMGYLVETAAGLKCHRGSAHWGGYALSALLAAALLSMAWVPRLIGPLAGGLFVVILVVLLELVVSRTRRVQGR